jgi:hypothetical protein
MSYATFASTTSEVALSANTPKAVIRLQAAGYSTLRLLSLDIMFKGTSSTDAPVAVLMARCSANGTATSTGSFYPLDPTKSDYGAQGNFHYNFSANPTSGGALKNWEIHPQSGIVYHFPANQHPIITPGAGLALYMTAAASQTVSVNFVVEEWYNV